MHSSNHHIGIWKSSESITTKIAFTNRSVAVLQEKDLANRRPPMPTLITTLGDTIAAVCSRCQLQRNYEFAMDSYAMGVKGMQDFNNKFIEFAHANTSAAFDFFQKLSSVQSPLAYVELSSENARKQIETLTEQTKQLAALVQKGTLAAAEPIKTSIAKAFNRPT